MPVIIANVYLPIYTLDYELFEDISFFTDPILDPGTQ